MKTTISSQYRVYKGLLNKQAYPHRVSMIQTEDTHISWIFLAGPYVYKIKKQVKFGRVLDFSTLSLRRKYCYKEVDLNRKLCKDMYIGVVRIITVPGKDNNIVVIADSPTKIGRVVEYAVKMKRIALQYRMDKLLTAHRISLENIRKIACILSSFHSRTSTNKEIQKYGRPRYLKYKVKENFQTLAKLKYFVTAGEQLPLELIRGGNETITYGPDFSTTGAYHIQGPIFSDNADYTIRAEISAVNGRPPETPIADEFSLQTIA